MTKKNSFYEAHKDDLKIISSMPNAENIIDSETLRYDPTFPIYRNDTDLFRLLTSIESWAADTISNRMKMAKDGIGYLYLDEMYNALSLTIPTEKMKYARNIVFTTDIMDWHPINPENTIIEQMSEFDRIRKIQELCDTYFKEQSKIVDDGLITPFFHNIKSKNELNLVERAARIEAELKALGKNTLDHIGLYLKEI